MPTAYYEFDYDSVTGVYSFYKKKDDNADHTITQFDVSPATFEQLLLGWEDFMVREAIWPEPEVETDALMV